MCCFGSILLTRLIEQKVRPDDHSDVVGVDTTGSSYYVIILSVLKLIGSLSVSVYTV